MANPNELVVSSLAAWNERDPRRRRDLVAKTWTDDGTEKPLVSSKYLNC